jgi:hypothetical protein
LNPAKVGVPLHIGKVHRALKPFRSVMGEPMTIPKSLAPRIVAGIFMGRVDIAAAIVVAGIFDLMLGPPRFSIGAIKACRRGRFFKKPIFTKPSA